MRNKQIASMHDTAFGCHGLFETAELLTLKCLFVEESGLIKRQNIECRVHDADRFSIHEPNDSAHCTHSLPREHGVAVCPATTQHLVELRKTDAIDTIPLIDH
jgi:hypothetical protein